MESWTFISKFFCLQESTEIALELNESEPRVGRSIDTRNFRLRVDSTNLTNVIIPNQNPFGNEIGKGSKKRYLMVLMNKNRTSWNILRSENKTLDFINFGNAIRMGDIEQVKQNLDEYGMEILSRREIFINVSFRSKNLEADCKEMDVLYLTPFHLGIVDFHSYSYLKKWKHFFVKMKVPPRFELGSLDSKSRVLTITPWDLILFRRK